MDNNYDDNLLVNDDTQQDTVNGSFFGGGGAKTMAMGIMYNNIKQERLNNGTYKYI